MRPGVNDGACATLVASEEAAKRHGLTPRARIVAAAVAGVAPRIMGFGPVARDAQGAGARASSTLADMAVIELNEAFAAQALAVTRDHGLADDDPRVNPNGGAIALGHPLGASGARLVTTAMYELRRSRRALRALHDVHRRRSGHCDDHRAGLATAWPRARRSASSAPGRPDSCSRICCISRASSRSSSRRRSRDYVEHRVRAGVLEHGPVELLKRAGVGEPSCPRRPPAPRHRAAFRRPRAPHRFSLADRRPLDHRLRPAGSRQGPDPRAPRRRRRHRIRRRPTSPSHDVDSDTPRIRWRKDGAPARARLRLHRGLRRLPRHLPPVDPRLRAERSSSAPIRSHGSASSPRRRRRATS